MDPFADRNAAAASASSPATPATPGTPLVGGGSEVRRTPSTSSSGGSSILAYATSTGSAIGAGRRPLTPLAHQDFGIAPHRDYFTAGAGAGDGDYFASTPGRQSSRPASSGAPSESGILSPGRSTNAMHTPRRFNLLQSYTSSSASFRFRSQQCFEPIVEKRRPAFRSRRLKPEEMDQTDDLWTKTPAGRRAKRNNYLVLLIGITLGVLAAAGVIVEGYLGVQKHNYCLVLEDNFDGPLDTSVWQYEQETGGFVAEEFQWTTTSANNSFTDDGKLYIVPTLTSDALGEGAIVDGYTLNLTSAGTCTARNRTDDYCAVASNSTTGVVLPPVQSARLTTQGTRSIKYGRVEVRARMPTGDWIWPSIWLGARDEVYGAWPKSGEIDIAESKGNAPRHRGDNVANALTSRLQWGPDKDHNGWWRSTGISKLWNYYYDTRYYTFGVEWDETSVWTWRGSRARKTFERRFDRDMWSSGRFPSWSNNGTAITNPWLGAAQPNIAPFDQDFYLGIKVAVGGTDGYFSDDDSATPNKPWSNSASNPRSDFWNNRNDWLPTWPKDVKQRGLAIDYVKMWQKC
ncbi:uncharacterized protein PFL1_04446 [Pseudozyma flocculosa PF-1]|uniref:Related to beta-1,3-glucan binding protein n=2 Tax=Pseudozyma flocculosa TaxID=84751 RepID=A0A5C3FCN8_9BASI|nr:uncharacterized protein PFL1_04446 [Pseudozyma flocculosa PF-1]EPQ28119.1 hypothetical protein PFL1_04446 [Pseudozyma flocculosa PF-1]SPO41916.1 related to beta-1,3-glucan binding protein [Pseudozyma flocculosa]